MIIFRIKPKYDFIIFHGRFDLRHRQRLIILSYNFYIFNKLFIFFHSNLYNF